jgi:hypothetical protein
VPTAECARSAIAANVISPIHDLRHPAARPGYRVMRPRATYDGIQDSQMLNMRVRDLPHAKGFLLGSPGQRELFRERRDGHLALNNTIDDRSDHPG